MSIAERVRPSRGLVVGVCVAAALLLAALAGGRPGRDGPPLDPRSDAPLGTSALVELVRRLGGRVDLTAGLPVAADDVALVLQDRLDPDQTADLERWVRDGGTIVVFGNLAPRVPALLDPNMLYSREITLQGSYSPSPMELVHALQLIASQVVKVEPLITHRIPLEDLLQAVELARARRAVKAIINPNG